MTLEKEYQSVYRTNEILYKMIACEYNSVDVGGILEGWKIRSVAIYGMGRLGRAFAYMILRHGMCIKYVVDKNENLQMDLNISDVRHRIDDITDDVDLIIITTINNAEDIKQDIFSTSNVCAISIEDFLDDLLLNPT